MLAIKTSADARFTGMTRHLGPGRVVRCPKCLESFVLYPKSPGTMNRANQRLLDYLERYCPNHVDCLSLDEAA